MEPCFTLQLITKLYRSLSPPPKVSMILLPKLVTKTWDFWLLPVLSPELYVSKSVHLSALFHFLLSGGAGIWDDSISRMNTGLNTKRILCLCYMHSATNEALLRHHSGGQPQRCCPAPGGRSEQHPCFCESWRESYSGRAHEAPHFQVQYTGLQPPVENFWADIYALLPRTYVHPWPPPWMRRHMVMSAKPEIFYKFLVFIQM